MMLKKLTLTTYILIGMAAFIGLAAFAQNNDAPQPQANSASTSPYGRFDVGGSFYQTFVSSSDGMGLRQTPSGGLGGLFEGRYLVSRLIGVEMAVGFHGNDQAFAPIPGACKLTCQNPPVAITASQVESMINYVPSYQFEKLRVFGVGGIGVLITIPGATPLGNNTSIRGAYDYGGGADYDINNHWGIRGQYRGIYYKAPNISAIYPATGQYTHIAMPMGGVFYRF